MLTYILSAVVDDQQHLLANSTHAHLDLPNLHCAFTREGHVERHGTRSSSMHVHFLALW